MATHREDGFSITSRSHDDVTTTPSASSSGRRPRPRPSLHGKDAVSFMALLADILRLQEQTLAMAYLYLHKYRKFIRDSKNRPDPVPDFLDPHTLALTTLSLSTKSTESPRRLRALITPAYSILHPNVPPIEVPSHKYDTIRGTIVTAELHLLRILKFELRHALPHDYIPRILDKSLSIVPGEDYDRQDDDRKEEDGIMKSQDTFLGRQCMGLATRCLAEYSVATFYDARTIACGVVAVVLDGSGILRAESMDGWVRRVGGGNVEIEDYRDVIKEVTIVFEGGVGVTVQEIPIQDAEKPGIQPLVD
ncbi:Cyclin- protein fam58a [Orbilia oligospora]|uniref:Cyclin-protein fam58a n=1 Tax=Orbilia oligospora TaxID=2813651 RepID=A0A7C8N056_ORBOL|nr:Cyclin- protein fam58a [Orbilia oligospora]KAF3117473.1 Cyclin- protein fam58a [Orbilia oligospora]